MPMLQRQHTLLRPGTWLRERGGIVLKDESRTLSAVTLKDSGGCDFVISEEGPGACEGIYFSLH